MNVTLPNGIVIENVPEGTSKEDIKRKAIQSGLATEADFEPERSIAEKAVDSTVGAAENIAAMASGAVATPLSGIAGLGASIAEAGSQAVEQAYDSKGLMDFIKNFNIDEGKVAAAGADTVSRVMNAITIQPTTETGKDIQKSIVELLSPVTEVMDEAKQGLGDYVYDSTGSPFLASVAYALPELAIEVLGAKGAGQAAKSKKLTSAIPSQKKINKSILESAPEIEQIKAASRGLYDELDNSGVKIKSSSLDRLINEVDKTRLNEGIDPRVTPKPYGAFQAIKDSVEAGNDVTLKELDTLRKVAKNAATNDPNDIRLSGILVDDIDNFMESLKSQDIISGNISAPEIAKKYKAARALWGRAKRAEMIEDAITLGASRSAGPEAGISNELMNITNNKKKRKFLSDADVEMLREVNKGDRGQNLARAIGKMGISIDRSPGIIASIIGGGGIGALSSSVPGLAGIAAPVAIGAITLGTASKQIAKKITTKKAKFTSAMSRAGYNAKEITRAYLQATPRSKQSIGDLASLLSDPRIDLSEIINSGNSMLRKAAEQAEGLRALTEATTILAAGNEAYNQQEEETNGQ